MLEEWLAHADRGAYNPRTIDGEGEPGPPPSTAKSWAPGLVLTSPQELELWLRNNLTNLASRLSPEYQLNWKVYKEMKRSLRDPRGSTVAIIPVEDLADMERTMGLFFQISAGRREPVLRVRTLCVDVQVLISDHNVRK